MITSIIHDVFLSNYSDKKRGHATLVDLDQINKWLYLSNLDLDDGIPYISNHREPLCSKMLDAKEKKDYIEEKYKIVHDILLLGNGKISLCGGSIIDILTKKRQPVDFDLFFHTGSIKEADDLLLKCMEYIDSLEDYDVEYWRSQGVQTVEIIGNKIYKIQFIRRVYETKDQILLGFDMAGCRIGYNPIDGFFATICGAMAFATGIFPLDLTQRSLSFGHRVDKYMIKGFTILLPGMDISMGRFITPDGVLYKID